jgi:hypothetical protein
MLPVLKSMLSLTQDEWNVVKLSRISFYKESRPRGVAAIVF